MSKPIVTVLTPTYQRGQRLEGLYRSLTAQSCSSFCWLIVDDGSTDNTARLVEEWQQEGRVAITFITKENGGKHTAINRGMPLIDTPLTFIVDSDDTLTPDAVERICADFAAYSERSDICGAAYLKEKPGGGILSSKTVPVDGLEESFCQCRYGRNIKGDMAEVWVTDCLRRFPFPEYENERFISEDVVWVQLSREYKMLFFNKTVYIADYYDDGLTASRRRLNLASPRGCRRRGEEMLKTPMPFVYSVKAMLYYTVYGRLAGDSFGSLMKQTGRKGLYCLCFPASAFFYHRFKKQRERLL